MAKVAIAKNDEIHSGEWSVSNQAYGGSEHDAAITIMSNDGIVATAATIHCGLIRAEEVARQISATPDLIYALRIVVAQKGVPSAGDWKVIRAALAKAGV